MALKRFFLLHAIAALLLISWLFGPTRILWDHFDKLAFNFLNGFVHTSPSAQKFWALASYKRAEYFMDAVRLPFFLIFIFTAPRALRRHRIATILFTIAFIFLTIVYVGKTLFPDVLQIERFSPTAADPDAFRLSKVIDWLYVKDASKASYPSDHGITACLFISCMFFLFGKRYGLAAIITEGYYCLPRLVAGAHWATDVIIGSGTIALLLSAWILCTPIARWCITFFEYILGKRHARVV